ncbi:tetratricopeptide repeat protein [Desulfocastanea catecholica]
MNGAAFRLFCFLPLLLVLFPATALFGGTAEESLFQEANRAYSRGDYTQAIEQYRQIITTTGYSPSLLYNLANSYALSGQPGQAVLNYERALRLAPSDPDISGNLQLVKKENGLFPKESSRTERFLHLLNLNQWTVLLLLSLILLTIFQAAAMKYRFSRPMHIGVMTSCCLLLCLAIAGTLFRYHSFNPSVVISPDAKLLLSPFASSASIGALQEGRLVYPQKRHGDFSYVTDETDRQGWIPSSLMEPVCATPAGADS